MKVKLVWSHYKIPTENLCSLAFERGGAFTLIALLFREKDGVWHLRSESDDVFFLHLILSNEEFESIKGTLDECKQKLEAFAKQVFNVEE